LRFGERSATVFATNMGAPWRQDGDEGQPIRWCSVWSEAPGLSGGELADPADDVNQLQGVPMTALGPIERGDQVVQDGSGGPAFHLDAHGDVRA
jgi:hypothetical protein